VIPGIAFNASNIMLIIYISIGCITVRRVTAKILLYRNLHKAPQGGYQGNAPDGQGTGIRHRPFCPSMLPTSMPGRLIP